MTASLTVSDPECIIDTNFMNILITGGAGFIGSRLGLYLTEKGHKVIPLDNLSFGYKRNFSGNRKLLSNFINLDIRSPKLEKIMKKVDVVFHLASISFLPWCNNHPNEAYQVNLGGTANVLEMARRNNVKRVIFSSTSAIYENETVLPFKESIQPKPTLIYAQTKKAGEELCKSFIEMYGMDIAILRFFNVYGPHSDYRPPSNLMTYIIQSLLKKEAPLLHSNGKQARDFIFVSDVVRLCEIAATHPKAKNEVFNVGSGKQVTVTEIFNIIAESLGEKNIKPVFRDPKLIWEKFPQQFQGNYPLDTSLLDKEVNKLTLASIKKAQKMLNWKAEINIKEGLTQTIAYALEEKEVKKI
jgi:nucleoside-diphosphate-sugar epimerase